MYIAIGKNNEGNLVVLELHTTSHLTNLSIASQLTYVSAAVGGIATTFLAAAATLARGLLLGERNDRVLYGTFVVLAEPGFHFHCAHLEDKYVHHFKPRLYNPRTGTPLPEQTKKFDRISNDALDGFFINATDGKQLETLYNATFNQATHTYSYASDAIRSYENRGALRETGLFDDDSPSLTLLKKKLGISFQPDPEFNDSELVAAVKKSDSNKILNLLANGANVNEVNEHGNSALIIAASLGKKDTVSTLINAGANPSLTNKAGDSATTVAIKRGHADTASLLLENNTVPRETFSEIKFRNIPKDVESINKLVVLCATHREIPKIFSGKQLDNSTNLLLGILTQDDSYSSALRKSEPTAPSNSSQLREWVETRCALPDNLKRSHHLQQLIESGVDERKANILADARLVQSYQNQELVADEIRQALYVRDFPYSPSVTELYLLQLAAESIYKIEDNLPVTEFAAEESRKMNELGEALVSLNKYHHTALAHKLLTEEKTDIKRDLASQRNAIRAKINSLEQVQTTEGETIELEEIGVLDAEMEAISKQEMIAKKQILLDEESQISRNAIPRLSVLSLVTVIENFEIFTEEEIQDLALESLNVQPSSITEADRATQVSSNAQVQR